MVDPFREDFLIDTMIAPSLYDGWQAGCQRFPYNLPPNGITGQTLPGAGYPAET